MEHPVVGQSCVIFCDLHNIEIITDDMYTLS